MPWEWKNGVYLSDTIQGAEKICATSRRPVVLLRIGGGGLILYWQGIV
jgi:hypothetical protein